LHSLGLLVENALEDVVLVVFGLDFAGLQVDDLPQLVHRVRSSEHLAEDFTGCLLQYLLKVLNRHVCGLDAQLHGLVVILVEVLGHVLALLFQQLCVRHVLLARGSRVGRS